ncbi:MAG: GNAT family N-acetyltransferase [Luteolibacter sp.]
MNPPTFRQIHYGSEEFREDCQLRDIVLRRPLGLSLFDDDLSQERDQMHFGLFAQSAELIACAIAVQQSGSIAKLRQMAVSAEHRGKGHGSALLAHIENHLTKQGFEQLELHARLTAFPFYKKAGYVEKGATFTEVGIPHVSMHKTLVNS